MMPIETDRIAWHLLADVVQRTLQSVEDIRAIAAAGMPTDYYPDPWVPPRRSPFAPFAAF